MTGVQTCALPISMCAEYEEKLNAVNAELIEALEKGENEHVEVLLEARKELSEEKTAIEAGEPVKTQETMTAGEFEELVNRMIEKVLNEKKSRTSSTLSDNDFGLVLEALRQDKPAGIAATSSTNDALLIELKALASKMDRNYETLLRANTQT